MKQKLLRQARQAASKLSIEQLMLLQKTLAKKG